MNMPLVSFSTTFKFFSTKFEFSLNPIGAEENNAANSEEILTVKSWARIKDLAAQLFSSTSAPENHALNDEEILSIRHWAQDRITELAAQFNNFKSRPLPLPPQPSEPITLVDELQEQKKYNQMVFRTEQLLSGLTQLLSITVAAEDERPTIDEPQEETIIERIGNAKQEIDKLLTEVNNLRESSYEMPSLLRERFIVCTITGGTTLIATLLSFFMGMGLLAQSVMLSSIFLILSLAALAVQNWHALHDIQAAHQEGVWKSLKDQLEEFGTLLSNFQRQLQTVEEELASRVRNPVVREEVIGLKQTTYTLTDIVYGLAQKTLFTSQPKQLTQLQDMG